MREMVLNVMVFGAMIAGVYMLKQRTRCLPEPNPAWCDRCPGYTPLHEPPPRETIGQRTRPPLLPGSAQVTPETLEQVMRQQIKDASA